MGGRELADITWPPRVNALTLFCFHLSVWISHIVLNMRSKKNALH